MSKDISTVERRCLITRKVLPKSELIRIALIKKLQVVVDREQNLGGRGCYISKHLSEKEIQRLWKTRVINKAFKINVPNSVYEELAAILGGQNETKT